MDLGSKYDPGYGVDVGSLAHLCQGHGTDVQPWRHILVRESDP